MPVIHKISGNPYAGEVGLNLPYIGHPTQIGRDIQARGEACARPGSVLAVELRQSAMEVCKNAD